MTVTLEIEATIPTGASEQLVRTVTENSRTLKFGSFGFEEDQGRIGSMDVEADSPCAATCDR